MAAPTPGKKFFGPKPSSVTSFAFFAVISVLLMVVDHQMRMMEPVRSGLSVVSNAAYNTLNAPVRLAEGAADRLRSKSSMIKENERLQEELARNKVLISRLTTLDEENRILKQMLVQKKTLPVRSEMFSVRRVLSDGFTQRFQIDGGSNDGLEVGMPVVSDQGLAGQLMHVAPRASQIQLIQDKNQEVPVLFVDSGVRGIVHGTGDDTRLQTRDLPYTDKIKVGEKVVTSGLDGIYPKGIPVGTVISAVPGETGAYVEVTVEAPKSIGKQDAVLVLMVDPNVKPLPSMDAEEESGDGQTRRRALRE